MKINILIDDINSWSINYGIKLCFILGDKHEVKLIHSQTEIEPCEVMFLLSCTKLCPKEKLQMNASNIVIHASDLPKGRGWSPLFWQIIEGKNIIPVTLFEAIDEVDAGDYYIKDSVELDGTELYDEIHAKLGNKIIEMAVRYINNYPMKAHKQNGEPTYYRKIINSIDHEIDINKTIREQFDLLRIGDNNRFPSFFNLNGQKYIIKIYKETN